MRPLVTAGLAVFAIVIAIWLGNRGRLWNDELALAPPPVAVEIGRADDLRTLRLIRRVVLIIVDGLGADEARLPYLDELRRRGVAATAHVPYPTISRPNYVTILTGVPRATAGCAPIAWRCRWRSIR